MDRCNDGLGGAISISNFFPTSELRPSQAEKRCTAFSCRAGEVSQGYSPLEPNVTSLITDPSPPLDSSSRPKHLDFCLGGGRRCCSPVSTISYQSCFHSLGMVGWRLGFSALCFVIGQTHLYSPLKLQCHWDRATGPASLCFIPSSFSSLEPPLLTKLLTHLWLFWV